MMLESRRLQVKKDAGYRNCCVTGAENANEGDNQCRRRMS